MGDYPNESEAIRVTVTDLKTLKTETMTIWNEFIIVTAGECYIAHTQHYKNGTVQLTIKGREHARVKKHD